MRNLVLLLLLSRLALAAVAPKSSAIETVTVEQLTALLSAGEGKPDAEAAADLAKIELSERLPSARFARLAAALPGDKSRRREL